jgi:DNA-binding NarL/FixJ family response regulator
LYYFKAAFNNVPLLYKIIEMETKINIVLLVDDSSIVTSRLIPMLEDVNNTQIILQATNCTQALQMMEEFNPDCVLIDIGIAGKTGISLLKEIQEKKYGSKVVVITNLANKQYKNYCERMGVNYFLDKSNEFELLPGIISGAKLN